MSSIGGSDGRGGAGAAAGSGDSNGNLYSTCAQVPLIKSPSLRVPAPVTLSNSLHPLPPNIQDYFVYPFSLERFVLDSAEKRDQVRREEMQRRAPGWIEGAGVLEPTKKSGSVSAEEAARKDEIDEIGAMLDQLGHK